MEQILAYKCGFCGKVYQREGVCDNHEKYCYGNPKNHFKCLDQCMFLKKTKSEGITEFTCTIRNTGMHSHVALRRKLECVERTELMKLECDLYQYKFESVFGDIDEITNNNTQEVLDNLPKTHF